MAKYSQETVEAVTTGTAGAATGSAQSLPIIGELDSISFIFGAAAPVTLTIVVSEVGGAEREFLDVTGNTDITYPLSQELVDGDGAGVTDYNRPIINGRRLLFTLTAGDADDPAVTAIIRYIEPS